MKFMTLLILLLITLINVFATEKTEIEYDDLTTKNFVEKIKDIPYIESSKICSYDYCDYLRGDTLTSSIEIFTKKYLNTIKDEEIKLSLKVKGIKITKIEFS